MTMNKNIRFNARRLWHLINQQKLFFAVALAALLFGCQSTGGVKDTANVGGVSGSEIVILHTNDVHGAIDGYAKVAALKQNYQEQGDYVLLLDAGDFIQGDVSVSMSYGADAIELMNAAGYDATAVGNHEMDYGSENLAALCKIAKFPIMAANITKGGKKPFISHQIFTAPDGTKVGVFALATPETATAASPAKIMGLSFLAGEDMFDCARNEVKLLKKAKCNVIVCLGHLGIADFSQGNRSIDLLQAVDGIDIFIDGHSHSTLDDIKKLIGDGAKVNGAVLTSTGTKAVNAGIVTVTYGDNREISVEQHPLADAPSDEAVSKMVQEIKLKIDERYGEVFAVAKSRLDGERETSRTRPTPLGSLITSAMLCRAQEVGQCDGAIINGGGIRASIEVGDVTKKDIHSVLPFGNTLYVVKVNGAQLLEALEASTFAVPEPMGGYPHVSGIDFDLDTTKPYDAGEMVSTYHKPASINRVTIKTVGNKPFDKDAIYSIAVNDFMAAGGDTYYIFKAAESYDTGESIDEVVIDYITRTMHGIIGG